MAAASPAKTNHLLSRDDILGARDLPSERVEVPEWGGAVLVRGLTGIERDEWELSMMRVNQSRGSIDASINMDAFRNTRARFVAKCLVDEDGIRMFSDHDVTELGAKSAVALNRVYEVAQRLSAITKEDVEELGKNSESGQSDDSGSD